MRNPGRGRNLPVKGFTKLEPIWIQNKSRNSPKPNHDSSTTCTMRPNFTPNLNKIKSKARPKQNQIQSKPVPLSLLHILTLGASRKPLADVWCCGQPWVWHMFFGKDHNHCHMERGGSETHPKCPPADFCQHAVLTNLPFNCRRDRYHFLWHCSRRSNRFMWWIRIESPHT